MKNRIRNLDFDKNIVVESWIDSIYIELQFKSKKASDLKMYDKIEPGRDLWTIISEWKDKLIKGGFYEELKLMNVFEVEGGLI